ncbi:MAG: hypothetical protein JF886_12180 [Candidatus Dormibacteraeota bacterium]|uniref:Uncharacterized protein n=1 Tax=Candidatus Aeolococcus gillhamiae TaxID=3127015 RepID=A0A2W6A8M6_9BACT|nr:hypothetical protein [Candidatus Dormibacteraeota bacterium]PZR81638.1 MAG: hypothetical protein DLM65_05460 [Candidatus Dormibacter sp. RRmetagenome_bin12]
MANPPIRELAEIVQLQKGRHRRPDDGVCAMELVAWMSGERHSDHPQSVSPIIAAFTRSFNDSLDAEPRQRLGALTARMIGTRGTRWEEAERCQVLWDWMITTAVPAWLAAAQRPDLAAAVASDRAAALDSVIVALDAYGHAPVRRVDDHRISSMVSDSLGASGVTGACLAGRDAADDASGSRARRRWESARVVVRAAAWFVAELEAAGDEHIPTPLARTIDGLRESAFAMLERLIGADESDLAPPPYPVPTAATTYVWSPDAARGVVNV